MNFVATKTSKIPKLRFPEFSGLWESKKLNEFLLLEIREIDVPKSPYLGIGVRSHFKGLMHRPNSQPSKIMMDKLYVVRPQDLVVNITFAWEGAVAIADDQDDGGLVSHRFPTFRFNEEVVLGDFFRYVFPNKRFKYELGLASPGGAGRNRVLSKKELLKIKIVAPRINEQRKITAFLGLLDDRISVLQKKVDLLQKYKSGVMQIVFSQEIRFKDGSGKDFPAWQEKKLCEIGDIVTGKTPSTTDKSLWEGKIPFVTPSDIKGSAKYQLDTERCIVRGKTVPAGSIMYTCIASIGKMSLAIKPSVTNQQINSVVPGTNVNNEYAYYALLWLTPKIVSTQANNTLPIINKTEFSKFKLPIPIQNEQQKIAGFLAIIDKKIEAQERKLDQAKLFKKALLQQMFV